MISDSFMSKEMNFSYFHSYSTMFIVASSYFSGISVLVLTLLQVLILPFI